MEINGLPAHPLLVHVVVVVLPLAAVAAVVVSIWPAAQRKLTFLVPLAAVAGLLAVPITTAAGNDLAASLGNPTFIARHRALGLQVLPWAAALAVTTTAQWLYLRGRRPGRDNAGLALAALVIVSAVGTAVIVALTGDAGARAVWGNR
jgi:hypothetical protein